MKRLFTLAILLITTTCFAQIPAPTNLSAEFKVLAPTPNSPSGFIELKWEYTYMPAVMPTFKIYKKSPGGANFVLLTQVQNLMFKDINFEYGKTYRYYVVAAIGNLMSPPSDTVSITTPPVPPMPEFVRFISEPVRSGAINVPYLYDANAVSSDSTAVIRYSLKVKPEGMMIDSITGVVTWLPLNPGEFKVAIVATSSKGASDTQVYVITIGGPKAFIKGFVFADNTNQPLPNTKIYFIGNSANLVEVAVTNEIGFFIKPLPKGSYIVKFIKEGYLVEYFDNKFSPETADIVILPANDTVNIIASLAQLPPPPPIVKFKLSGTILNAAGLPVKSKVTAITVKPLPTPGSPILPEPVADLSIVTDSMGNYKFYLIGGRQYIIFAQPADPKYYPEFWDNKREYAQADKILLDTEKTNINFIMDLKPVYPNGISGKVRHFTGNQEGVMANVTAFILSPNKTDATKTVLTDSLGNYVINNLVPGKYILRAIPKPPYLPGYYKQNGVTFEWRKADTVIVTESGIVENIIINLKSRLDSGWAVAGGKLKTSTEELIGGGIVYAVDNNNEVAGFAITENDGSYALGGLDFGNYTMVADLIDYDNVSNPNIIVNDNTGYFKADILISPAQATGYKNEVQVKPVRYDLTQNYPNPFNPATLIKYSVPERAFVTLKVYNILGTELLTLVNGIKEAGNYEVRFDAGKLSSGVYFYKLESGKNIITKKMMLIK